MTSYADTQAALTAADQNGFGFITVELDSGELTMTTAEAIEMFDDLAPGEPFVIVSAHRTEANPAPYMWKSPWWTFSATPAAEDAPMSAPKEGGDFLDFVISTMPVDAVRESIKNAPASAAGSPTLAKLEERLSAIENDLGPHRGRRDYFQLGRSELLHVVIVDPKSEVDLTLCGRAIYETGRIANDVEDQPLCTNCRRKFDKLPK